MISNTTFPFYTSTGSQDANRLNTPAVRICPRDRLLPFQIQRSHNTSAINAIKLIDCSGGETSLGTGYFSSIGTTITDDSSLGVKFFTDVDYMQYAGGTLETDLPYGVYYIALDDSYGRYYSEHFSVRDLTPSLAESWGNITGGGDGYDTFISTGRAISTAINAAGIAYAAFGASLGAINIGQQFKFQCNLTISTGEAPYVKIGNTAGTAVYSDTPQLSEGLNDTTITVNQYSAGSLLVLYNTGASTFSMSWARLIDSNGNFVKIEFSNTDDLRHSNGDDIMYSTGGWKQRVYFDTQLNLPAHEPIEIGEELNGKFIAEQLNSTYLYSVVSYVSRSMYNGMQYLRMHDSITITDEVGNEYSPDVGNLDMTIDWNTFDTGSLKVMFNDGSMTWVNDQQNIT